MSPDNQIVTLQFEGGRFAPATDPCHTDYAAWAQPAGDELEVAVVLLPDLFEPSTESACAAAAVERTLQVQLPAPFSGLTARDVNFGTEIPLDRPTPEPSRRGAGT